MKKSLFTIVLALCYQSNFAQTLTHANTSPVPGDVYYKHLCDTTGVTHGASGTGVTWNFSSLVTNLEDSALALGCASTPKCDSFPESTVVIKRNYFYVYTKTNSSEYTSLGSYSTTGAGTLQKYEDAIREFKYPVSYGTSQQDTGYFNYSGINIYFYDSTLADATGTLYLPYDTITNVLRIRKKSELEVRLASGSIIDKSVNLIYQWYKDGYHNPVLSITYADTNLSGNYYITNVTYDDISKLPPTGIEELENSGNKLLVYPNPAKNEIKIQTSGRIEDDSIFIIADMVGRSYNCTINKNNNQPIIDVSGLNEGIYRLTIKTKTSVQSVTFTKN